MGKPLTFAQRWIIPEIYPIVAVIGTALGLCGTAIIRNATINPDVRFDRSTWTDSSDDQNDSSGEVNSAGSCTGVISNSMTDERAYTSKGKFSIGSATNSAETERVGMGGIDRINKDDRAAGWLENYKEGRAYKDSAHRRFLARQSKMVTTTINEAFGGPSRRR